MNITIHQVEDFVMNFYGKVSQDNLLGPIFNGVAKLNFDKESAEIVIFKALNIADSLKFGMLKC